jgi:hypothetical protein
MSEEIEILPCPHCGSKNAPNLSFETGTTEKKGENTIETGDYWQVVCDASSDNSLGGCGASGSYHKTEKQAIKSWNRRSKTPDKPKVPSGYKLVPIEPTDEMLRQALIVESPATYAQSLRRKKDGPKTQGIVEADIDRVAKQYHAMLDASPQPPEGV